MFYKKQNRYCTSSNGLRRSPFDLDPLAVKNVRIGGVNTSSSEKLRGNA